MKGLEYIFIAICVFILSISLTCYLFSPSLENYISTNEDKISHITLDDVMKNVENGDIILFSGTTFGEKSCKWFTESVFSHIGFLFREIHPQTKEDIIYIFECDLGQGCKEGVRIISLIDKLDRYKGCRTAAIKKLIVSDEKKRPENHKIMDLVNKYESVNFDNKIITWWVSNYPVLYNFFKNPQTMFCSELVSKIYQDFGIIKKYRPASSYHPGDYHFNKLDFEDGYFLGETQIFNFPKNT